MKKTIALILSAVCLLTLFAGCGANKGFDPTNEISVITREEGSGTRGAFVELFGIEEEDKNGEKVDKTVMTADTQTSTGVVLTSVASNVNAIGYISLGSLNDTVKALQIDGVAPSIAAVKDGSYKISRPFNIATKADLSEAGKDFKAFILSQEGQKVIEDAGYIAAVENAPAFAGGNVSGTVTVSGSSSVTPVMEKLKEAYAAKNPSVTVEINMSDSTTGMTDAANGNCDIGMASRELKDSETAKGLEATVIALDGIAVIVNPENTLTSLTPEQVKAIYTGSATTWDAVQ